MPQRGQAISLAAELGLFELAAFLLAVVAILLALGAVFAFLHLRSRAKKVARDEAQRIAVIAAEKIAVEYLEAELPKMMQEFRELAKNAVEDDQADEIALAQPNEREDGR